MGSNIATRQVLVAIVAASLFVAVSMYLDGYLAAVPYPSWYVDFAGAHRPLGLYLWWFLERGVPDAVMAALCAVVLVRLARSARLALGLIAVGVWILAPLVLDLSGPVMWSEEMHGIALFWPATALNLILVCVTFLVAFRYAARRSSTSLATAP